MDKEHALQLAREMLTEHVEQCLPCKETRLKDIDLAAIDAHVCNLVACLVKHKGDLDEINAYYQSKGLSKDYKGLIKDAQEVLDKLIPELADYESKQYFARLSRMSIVAAEISLADTNGHAASDEEEGERSGDSGDWKKDMRITADLDEGLMEFRRLIARKKLEEHGLNALEILKE